jgi:hypothetical protein
VAGFSRLAPGGVESASGGAVNCKKLEQDSLYVDELLAALRAKASFSTTLFARCVIFISAS